MKFSIAYCTAAIMLMVLSTEVLAHDHERGEHDRPKSIAPQQSPTAVPEPEVYGMMLAGLGIVGFAARRKLKTKAVKD